MARGRDQQPNVYVVEPRLGLFGKEANLQWIPDLKASVVSDGHGWEPLGCTVGGDTVTSNLAPSMAWWSKSISTTMASSSPLSRPPISASRLQSAASPAIRLVVPDARSRHPHPEEAYLLGAGDAGAIRQRLLGASGGQIGDGGSCWLIPDESIVSAFDDVFADPDICPNPMMQSSAPAQSPSPSPLSFGLMRSLPATQPDPYLEMIVRRFSPAQLYILYLHPPTHVA